MEILGIIFPVSGVETYVFVPLLTAFIISFFTSMAGVSGAFLLLPFQMSYLNFTSPSVSATNLVYNIVAIPSGVYRYIRERRMAWPLTWVISLGTLPGVFAGYYIRVIYLPEPRGFKFFVGCVLLYIFIRLAADIMRSRAGAGRGSDAIDTKFRGVKVRDSASRLPSSAVVRTVSFSFSRVEYEFWGETFSFNTVSMFLLAFFVGIIGGTYGIGGGAIIAPFCVAVFRLPVYTVAGAALMGTFITSIAGVLFYSLIPADGNLVTSPDWLLGALFGAGGFAGMYAGARCQKYVPQILIKLLIGMLVAFVAVKYILQYFMT